MIGDWVLVDSKPTKVDNVDVGNINATYCGEVEDYIEEEKISPIPLTPEILKKNEFVFNSWGRRYWYEGFGLALDYGAKSKELYLRLFRINRHVHIHYVHELQHVFRLCGLNEIADNFKIE